MRDQFKKPEADADSEELMAIKIKVVEKILMVEIYVKSTFKSRKLILNGTHDLPAEILGYSES